MFSNPVPQFRVLCIAQDPMDRIVMQDYAWILDWDLSVCGDLDHCMDLAAAERFDLIISDLQRGPPCGIDLVKAVRLDCTANAEIPALLLTEADFPERAVRYTRDMGGAVLWEKPLLLSDLKAVAGRLTGTHFGHYGSAGRRLL